jgi:selenocysteine lyase/cysteine desulfurase
MLTRWRAETPGTAHRIHLNNAGASLMPAPVHTAIVDHLRLESEIGGYEAAEVCAEAIATGYEDLAALLGTRPRNIAVVANATAGFVQALSSFDFAPGDVIVTSRCDYTSNQIQYLALRDRLGIEIVHAPDLPEGGIDPDGLRAAIVGPRPMSTGGTVLDSHQLRARPGCRGGRSGLRVAGDSILGRCVPGRGTGSH